MHKRIILAPFFFMLAVAHAAADSREKILAESPDGKFALRIVYDAGSESATPWTDPAVIRHAQLVRLPGKTPVAEVASVPPDETRAGAPELLWSADSQWCVFTGLSESFRETNILVFRLAGEKFADIPPDGLTAEAPVPKGNRGDVRAEFTKPLRWLKPGTLLLQQETHFRVTEENENGRVYLEVTATFSEKTGSFVVASAKPVKGAADFAREADVELNAAYKQLQGKLSAAAKATLKKEQLAWLKRRDAIADLDQHTAFVAARAAELRKRAAATR